MNCEIIPYNFQKNVVLLPSSKYNEVEVPTNLTKPRNARDGTD